MWFATFRIQHDDWILKRTVRYNVTAFGTPLNSYVKKGVRYYNSLLVVRGKNKKKFIDSVRKDKRIIRTQVRGNQLFVLSKEKENVTPLLDKRIFHTQPVFFSGGYEYWHLACWEKEPLMKFYKKVEAVADISIVKIEEGAPPVFIQHTIPRMTQKQIDALMIAAESGYYDYPRTVDVKQLAKRNRTARTTFQEHLRKAESKIMDVLIG